MTGYRNNHRNHKARHNPTRNPSLHLVGWTDVERALGLPTIDDLRAQRLEEEREQLRQQYGTPRQPRKTGEKTMTVSLYRSCATGAREIVVQTNAQSLDVFIDALSDALESAIASDPTNRAATIAATLRNAFPVAFAIAGYKADKVTESKLLTCGFASPDAAELVAQSKI
jgi:hypothetical protein